MTMMKTEMLNLTENWDKVFPKSDKVDHKKVTFIHCQDELSDWETYQRNGVFNYLLELKAQGVVRRLGLSSHTPAVIQKIMDDVQIDMNCLPASALIQVQPLPRKLG